MSVCWKNYKLGHTVRQTASAESVWSLRRCRLFLSAVYERRGPAVHESLCCCFLWHSSDCRRPICFVRSSSALPLSTSSCPLLSRWDTTSLSICVAVMCAFSPSLVILFGCQRRISLCLGFDVRHMRTAEWAKLNMASALGQLYAQLMSFHRKWTKSLRIIFWCSTADVTFSVVTASSMFCMLTDVPGWWLRRAPTGAALAEEKVASQTAVRAHWRWTSSTDQLATTLTTRRLSCRHHAARKLLLPGWAGWRNVITKVGVGR